MGLDITKMSKTRTTESSKIENVKTLEDTFKFKLITKEEIASEKIKGYQYAI